MNEIRERMFALKDESYKAFQCKLMPTVDTEKVIGIRMPDLRKLSKELWKDGRAGEFMKNLPHEYYEENNLHASFIEKINDFDNCVEELESFLPFVDNWATCDMMNPKVLKKEPEKLLIKVKEWLKSEHTYTVRFGIGVLMRHFLDEGFKKEYPQMVAKIKSDEYYIKMMVAWYFATALSKQYDAILPFIKERCLDPWTHRKAVQKAVESYRITPEQKEQLRKLR